MDSEKDRIYRSCTRFLGLHYPQSPRHALAQLASAVDEETTADRYGEGDVIASFEKEVAEALGKESAVFMPSGTMCQQIALRIWAEQRGTSHIAFHPTSHLELHEQGAYRHLHHLSATLVGSPDSLFNLEDLNEIPMPLAALLIELPQREIGGQLPLWEELCAIGAWARERDVRLHLDGARLWECKPFYQRSYSEIASLFDTVYVSFYKGLGGIAGAILAGPDALIAESRIWQRRHGGNLVRLYPYVLSAREGMKERLPRMQQYYEKAQEVAGVFKGFPQISIKPEPPQTNMMHVYMEGEPQALERAALEVARESGVWLFRTLRTDNPTETPMFELPIGDAGLDLKAEEIEQLFQSLFQKASLKVI
jgi:threonine aldolase